MRLRRGEAKQTTTLYVSSVAGGKEVRDVSERVYLGKDKIEGAVDCLGAEEREREETKRREVAGFCKSLRAGSLSRKGTPTSRLFISPEQRGKERRLPVSKRPTSTGGRALSTGDFGLVQAGLSLRPGKEWVNE